MQTRKLGRRPSFTLIELLVAISIIAILLTLVTVAGYRAIIHVRQHTIAMEVQALEQAINEYKTKYQDFPPDFSNVNVVVAHLKKAFPRHRENVVAWCAANPMTPDEALVFWLGGGVIENQEFPLSGPGNPKKFYDFATARLIDLDGNGRPSFVPAYGAQQAPYVYFESRTYGATYAGNATLGFVCPYGADVPTPPSLWESPTTFQIISAGLDGHFGAWPTAPPFTAFKFYPSGTAGVNRVPYSKQDQDNVTSFADGPLSAKLP